jgi:hypothetical protein
MAQTRDLGRYRHKTGDSVGVQTEPSTFPDPLPSPCPWWDIVGRRHTQGQDFSEWEPSADGEEALGFCFVPWRVCGTVPSGNMGLSQWLGPWLWGGLWLWRGIRRAFLGWMDLGRRRLEQLVAWKSPDDESGPPRSC